ncbi:DUF2207 domain-containing protein [Rhodobium gokarnense]|uniref:DUF2207 domain-containing protein n=1 Tax=Rhodobium gokarnense TaxID=364296 RepID=A0ABT3HCX7_9HYPH|nr:DUF2207 domain-containing protein [Rhodobium gokarnense]MCW2308262.1 hypothetical protein [Rhodobium gokarnense]
MRQFLALVILALAFAASPAKAEEEILSYESDIVVAEDGTLDVTETIRVRAEGRKIKRGIYRDFPVQYRTANGLRRAVGFDVIEIRRDGKKEPWHSAWVDGYERIYIGDEDVFLNSGEYTYTIRYETTHQLRFFAAYDELYWNVTGNFWDFPIRRAVARIALPQAAEILQRAAYTGYQGDRGRAYRVSNQGFNTITFETTRPLARNQGLTVGVGFSKGVVDEPGPVGRFLNAFLDNFGLFLLVVGTFGVGAYFFAKWLEVGRDPEGGVIIPLYEPPKGLSPAALSYLHYQTFASGRGGATKAFIAALLSLAVKGRIRLDEEGKKKVALEAADRRTDDLPGGERALMDGFLGGRDRFVVERANATTLVRTRAAFRKAILTEYEGKFFRNNYFVSIVGAVISVAILIAFIFFHAPTDTELGTMIIAAFSGFGGAFLLSMGLYRLLGWIPGGSSAIAGTFLTILGAVIFAPSLVMPLLLAGAATMIPAMVVALCVLNILFFGLMRAPTVIGRRIMDETEGFKMFLSVAEADRMNMIDAPDVTEPVFEKYLPYAIALGVEKPWSNAFSDYLARARPGEIVSSYHPGWYRGGSFDVGHIGSMTSGIVSAVGSSVSAATPSSSGSSGGGSSGGGGGGGGGGGW